MYLQWISDTRIGHSSSTRMMTTNLTLTSRSSRSTLPNQRASSSRRSMTTLQWSTHKHISSRKDTSITPMNTLGHRTRWLTPLWSKRIPTQISTIHRLLYTTIMLVTVINTSQTLKFINGRALRMRPMTKFTPQISMKEQLWQNNHMRKSDTTIQEKWASQWATPSTPTLKEWVAQIQDSDTPNLINTNWIPTKNNPKRETMRSVLKRSKNKSMKSTNEN